MCQISRRAGIVLRIAGISVLVIIGQWLSLYPAMKGIETKLEVLLCRVSALAERAERMAR